MIHGDPLMLVPPPTLTPAAGGALAVDFDAGSIVLVDPQAADLQFTLPAPAALPAAHAQMVTVVNLSATNRMYVEGKLVGANTFAVFMRVAGVWLGVSGGGVSPHAVGLLTLNDFGATPGIAAGSQNIATASIITGADADNNNAYAVTFATPAANASYNVLLTPRALRGANVVLADAYWSVGAVTNKTANGFTFLVRDLSQAAELNSPTVQSVGVFVLVLPNVL